MRTVIKTTLIFLGVVAFVAAFIAVMIATRGLSVIILIVASLMALLWYHIYCEVKGH